MAETPKTFPECLSDPALERAVVRLRYEHSRIAESVRREYERRTAPPAPTPAPAPAAKETPTERLSDAALVNAYELLRFDRSPQADRVRAEVERRAKSRRVVSGRVGYAWDRHGATLQRIEFSHAQVVPSKPPKPARVLAEAGAKVTRRTRTPLEDD